MDNSSIKYMVIGNPARHSLSPVMQNAAFELIGEGAVYGYRELDIDDLDSFAEFAAKNLKGFNITAPYKRDIMRFCGEIDAEALRRTVSIPLKLSMECVWLFNRRLWVVEGIRV